LLTFSLLVVNQNLLWLTYSPVSSSACAYYGIDTFTIDLLLNYGPIISLPAGIFVPVIVAQHGLRSITVISALLMLCAALVRLPPSLPFGIDPHSDFAVALVHMGGILNALAAPALFSLPARVSATWFPSSERSTATAVGLVMQSVGCAIGLLSVPLLVTDAQQIPNVLYFHVVTSGIACACVIAYFPSAPPTPPSRAAALQLQMMHSLACQAAPTYVMLQHAPPTAANHDPASRSLLTEPSDDPGAPSRARSSSVSSSGAAAAPPSGSAEMVVDPNSNSLSADAAASRRASDECSTDASVPLHLGSDSSSSLSFSAPSGAALPQSESLVLREFRTVLRNRSFLLQVTAQALPQGAFGVWAGALNTLLAPLNYSDLTIALLGFSSLISTILAGFLGGRLLDRPSQQRALKKIAVGAMVLAVLVLLWWTLSLPSFFSSEPLLPASTPSLFVSVTLLGAILGAVLPLAYELAAETTYPVSEAVSAGVLSWLINLSAVLFLLIAPFVDVRFMNVYTLACAAASVLLLLPVKDEYKRFESDQQRKRERKQRREEREKGNATSAEQTPVLQSYGATEAPLLSPSVSSMAL
jgi:hypothetical protein